MSDSYIPKLNHESVKEIALNHLKSENKYANSKVELIEVSFTDACKRWLVELRVDSERLYIDIGDDSSSVFSSSRFLGEPSLFARDIIWFIILISGLIGLKFWNIQIPYYYFFLWVLSTVIALMTPSAHPDIIDMSGNIQLVKSKWKTKLKIAFHTIIILTAVFYQ